MDGFSQVEDLALSQEGKPQTNKTDRQTGVFVVKFATVCCASAAFLPGLVPDLQLGR